MNDMSFDKLDATAPARERPGDILRIKREAQGMSIDDVAESTRIARRQLLAVERSDFAALPGTPYAVGFARAYARAVGADEVAIAQGVREELGMLDAPDRYEMFEPVDPARVPPRWLAWAAAIVALVLAVGYGVWRTQFFAASTEEEIADLNDRADEAQSREAAARPAPAAPTAAGPVVLTARESVWLRISDRSGKRLFEKQMAQGESYTVPADADAPVILTGRPDVLAVTVGGRPVAPLGAGDRTIADYPVSAQALLARPAPVTPPPLGSASAAPASATPAATTPPSAAAASSPVAATTADSGGPAQDTPAD